MPSGYFLENCPCWGCAFKGGGWAAERCSVKISPFQLSVCHSSARCGLRSWRPLAGWVPVVCEHSPLAPVPHLQPLPYLGPHQQSEGMAEPGAAADEGPWLEPWPCPSQNAGRLELTYACLSLWATVSLLHHGGGQQQEGQQPSRSAHGPGAACHPASLQQSCVLTWSLDLVCSDCTDCPIL